MALLPILLRKHRRKTLSLQSRRREWAKNAQPDHTIHAEFGEFDERYAKILKAKTLKAMNLVAATNFLTETAICKH
jgi:hypothetical protein